MGSSLILTQNQQEQASLRISEPRIKTAPHLVLYEMGYDEKVLFDDIQRMFPEFKLEHIQELGIPTDVVNALSGTGVVPLQYSPSTRTVIAGDIAEMVSHESRRKLINVTKYNVNVKCIPIYQYVKLHNKYYGNPDFILPMPAKVILESIVEEGISLGASDITISTTGKSLAYVYFQVKKRRIDSKKILTHSNVSDIRKIILINSKSMDTESQMKPIEASYQINENWRTRVEISVTSTGYLITMRLLPATTHLTSLEGWNVSKPTADFLREIFVDKRKGLKLIIGGTESGKNTTMISALWEKAKADPCKIVSVEKPVELEVDFMEQIDSKDSETYSLNVQSLLRHNPDVVYITEINKDTAVATLETANTGKEVYSSLHANCVADVVSRLADITSMSYDRIISSLTCCVYQELVRNPEHGVLPRSTCVNFTPELKRSLYGKSLGEIIETIDKIEKEWKEIIDKERW